MRRDAVERGCGALASALARPAWLARLIIGVPYVWLLLFFLLPFLIVVAMSLATRAMTAPPFAFARDFPFVDLENYRRLFEDSLYVRAFLISLGNAALATVFCLLLGYPMALGLDPRRAGAGATSCCCWSSCRSGPRSCCASMPGWG